MGQVDLYDQLLRDFKPLGFSTVGLQDQRKDVELGALFRRLPAKTGADLKGGRKWIMEF